MRSWKKALIVGSLSAGALMLIKGNKTAGVALATVGLAVLAGEYPEKFETVWENAPEYVNRATQIWSSLSRIAERFAEEAQRRGLGEAWQEASSEFRA